MKQWSKDMKEQAKQKLSLDQPATYQIKVPGELDMVIVVLVGPLHGKHGDVP